MGIFSRKKEETKEEVKSTKQESKKDGKNGNKQDVKRIATVSPFHVGGIDLSKTIITPRITEKAVKKSDDNVYTFVVRKEATKYEVRDAVKELFKVTPVKINIVNKAPRRYKSAKRGRMATEKGMKKAYIYLKEGDKIDLA